MDGCYLIMLVGFVMAFESVEGMDIRTSLNLRGKMFHVLGARYT